MSHEIRNNPRIAFIFTGSREETLSLVRKGESADTALRGMNHLPGSEYFTIPPKSLQALRFVPRLLAYDFVIAQDNLALGYLVSLCARMLGYKTRWIYIAMNSSTLIRRNAVRRTRLFLLKKFWASYARIICLSRDQLNDFVRLGIARERLVFVPFGVDARFFQSSNVPREEELIVSVGRDAGRDYATLFRAAEMSGHPFVVVAGRKNIPPDAAIPLNVSVLYDRSYAEIRALYGRARIVVVASKNSLVPDGSDCSGQTVILDALAAGKAVIATERSWINDYFVPGQDLEVVPPSDPEALSGAIESLWNDAEKRKQLSESGRNKVVTQYTTEKFAEGLLALILPAP